MESVTGRERWERVLQVLELGCLAIMIADYSGISFCLSLPWSRKAASFLEKQEEDVERRKTSHLSSVQQRGWEVVREEGAQAKWFIYRDLPFNQ